MSAQSSFWPCIRNSWNLEGLKVIPMSPVIYCIKRLSHYYVRVEINTAGSTNHLGGT